MEPTTHLVRQRPSLRALVLAAAFAVAGIVLILMAHLVGWFMLLVVLGALCLMVGAGLFAAALVVARSMTVEIRLDAEGYQVRGSGTSETGRWADLEKVTGNDGLLTLHRKDGSTLRLATTSTSVLDMDAIASDIASRMDADRGYR